MPRPKKPTEQKRRLGNPGHRPLPNKSAVVQLAPMEETPEPSRPLGEAGLTAWVSAWREAGAWLAPPDADVVLMYAEAVDDYVQLQDSLHRRGFDGVTMWRERKQMMDLAKQVVRLAGDLGLSAAARAQLGVAELRVADGPANLLERGSVAGVRTIEVDERTRDR
jgi:phage terminase small subunit